MNRTTKYTEVKGYNTIMMLDGATQLRMAQDKERRPARIAPAPAPVAEHPTMPMAREAKAGAILMAVFTGAVWLLLTYFRSH